MSSPRVLCVDDNPANIYWLKRTLESEDIQTIVAMNGEEALAQADANIDLVPEKSRND